MSAEQGHPDTSSRASRLAAHSAAQSACELVSRRALESQLQGLISRTDDPRAGLFGPQSKLWEVNREAILFLGSGRAALLQLAHPYVAQAIDQHSATRTDPLGRFRRTFYNVFAMVFGDLEAALASARRVHAVHTRISGVMDETAGEYAAGSPYRANEKHALLWVHATLWESSVFIFEKVLRPLAPEEKEEYYRETRLFAYLFGLDDSVLPPDWTQFEEYNRCMWESSRLAVGQTAGEIGEFLLQPLHPVLAPVAAWFRIMTAALLPEPLRQGFGLSLSAGERRVYERSLALLRGSHRLWPRRLRYVPPYLEAQRRLAGRPGRDRIGEFLTRLYLGQARDHWVDEQHRLTQQ